MTLAANISGLVTRVGTEFKAIRTLIGGSATATLSGLTTTDKSSLVGAVNEVKASVSGAAGINDATTTTSSTWSSSKVSSSISSAVAPFAAVNDGATNTVNPWSGSKTNTEIGSQVTAATNALVNSAPGTLDTLGEIATQLAADESGATAMNTAIGNRVRYDAAQTLNGTQQAQARTNIAAASDAALTTLTTNVGDTTVDLVAAFNTAVS